MRNGAWWFHRKLWDNPIFYGHGMRVALWVWMLSEACWQDGEKEVFFNGERIKLKAGQFTAGRRQMAHAVGCSEMVVRSFVACLKSNHQISQQSDNKKSLYTILNWRQYQNKNQQKDQQVASKYPASSQQVATTEEGNKVIKKEGNILQPPNAVAGSNEINKIIDLFQSVNPNWERLFSNNIQRGAAERLLKKNGFEWLEKMLASLPKIIEQPYAPKITSPFELERDMGKLAAFVKQTKTKQENTWAII